MNARALLSRSSLSSVRGLGRHTRTPGRVGMLHVRSAKVEGEKSISEADRPLQLRRREGWPLAHGLPFGTLFGSTPLAPPSVFDDVRRVMETMENLLDSPMLLAHGGTTIPLDVVEKPTMYEVKADLPGFVKSDVKIEVKDGYGEPNMGPMLILTAERKFEDEDEGKEGEDIVHYSERSRATLKRMVRLPITADADNVTAKLDHGLLCINIMKKESEVEEPVTRVIDVEES